MTKIIKDWWPSVLTLCVVLWLTLSSHPLPDMDVLPLFPHVDKVVHFIMFGGLTGAIMFDALRRQKQERRRLSPTFYWCLCAAMLFFAYADEWAQQAMNNGRSQDILDFCADAGGIITALLTGAPIIRFILRKS